MIETYFGSDALDSGKALLAALVIGFLFGFSLERAGFSSSRKLAGIFYFTDMTVLKVMFTALITAMIGLSYCMALGWIRPESLFLMDTIYGAQIVGGLLFGLGFAMGGWCPGTAAAGLAAGKMDALLFLGGAAGGSILFNELFAVIKPVYTCGASGVVHIYDSIGISKPLFALLFTLAAVGCFWGAEYIELRRGKGGGLWNSPFLKAFSLALIVAAVGLLVIPAEAVSPTLPCASSLPADESAMLQRLQEGEDHIEPEDLADRLLAGDSSLALIDIRTPGEFAAFHIRTAVNVAMADLPAYMASHAANKTAVLYSNGMTHPAQARDALDRMGYSNVYLLTDGLDGFMQRCLKPVSLRGEPVPEPLKLKIQSWRSFFLETAKPDSEPPPQSGPAPAGNIRLPGLVETAWLADNLGRNGIHVIDTRSQPEYNSGHIPGSFCLNPESVRGNSGGLPSMLLPADMLARVFALMGMNANDTVILVYGDKVQDATLIAMALERIGHSHYAVLNGGFSKWTAEKRAVDTILPSKPASSLVAKAGSDTFTVDADTVLRHQKNKTAAILDVRPADFFSGVKSDEARAGHIPGAINRPYTEDVVKADTGVTLKPAADLQAAYAKLFPSKDAPIIVHCRTGHQASQTFFVLKHLLGYTNILYYDAGWTEWAAHPELPVAK
ncbi:MAG TPA: rhodanese-like domain-containing protein [Candidatus Hydrogenedentes bacterium]|nr:rhodanese-like domain-containing protein [Candidatus Hydrogenedentota bacterium]